MSREENSSCVFEGPNDFVSFLLKDNGAPLKEIKQKIPPISNLCTLKKSLDVKPCGCGGKDPKTVMERRMKELDNFYERLIVALSNNFNGKLGEACDAKLFAKETILKNSANSKRVTFKLKGETLLELI